MVRVDPVILLAEVLCRLRAEGVVVPGDYESLAAVAGHVVGLLVALGVPADVGALPDVDWLLLRCAAVPRS